MIPRQYKYLNKSPPVSYTMISNAKMKELYWKKNLTLEKIAKIYGVNNVTILNWMKKYKIPRRTYWNKLNISKELLQDLYHRKKMSSLKIAEKLGANSRTIRRIMERYEIPRRTLSEACTKNQKTPFDDNSQTKAYMIGLRTGDVHARYMKRSVRAQTSTTHPAQVEMMRRTFEKFSKVCIYKFFNKRAAGRPTNEWFVYSDLHPTFSWLIEKPDSTPKWILNKDRLFWQFLSGYMDSEASWKVLKSHKDSLRFVLRIATQDKKILEQINSKLRSLGYNSLLYFDTHAGIRSGRLKNNLDMYALMVYRRADIISMCRKLLHISKHDEKIKQMKLILEHKDATNWSRIKEDVMNLRQEIKNSRLV